VLVGEVDYRNYGSTVQLQDIDSSGTLDRVKITELVKHPNWPKSRRAKLAKANRINDEFKDRYSHCMPFMVPKSKRS